MLRRYIRRVRDIIIKHSISFSSIIAIFSFVYFVLLQGEGGFSEFMEMSLIFIFSIPSVIFGILISKEMAPKAGLGFGLFYLTYSIYLQITSPILWGLDWTLRFLPFALSLGILTTWAGSVVGDSLRHMSHRENLKISLRSGFLLIYFYPILIFIILQLRKHSLNF